MKKVNKQCLLDTPRTVRVSEKTWQVIVRSTKHYIKSHLELQREITLIELAPSPYFFVSSICLAYMNMFARFDENPAMTLRVIKEKSTILKAI